MTLYQVLVNRKDGIRERYHRMHDGAVGIRRIVSWGWLLWLNLCYYLFFCRFLGKSVKTMMYEEKRIPLKKSESEIACEKCDADGYAARLMQYDLISFDLFDTLIFRPFSAPGDLFFLLGEKLNFPDFKRIRMESETLARAEKHEESGSWEVNLDEIWSVIERETGLSAAAGARLECELELELDYANPFMRDVFGRLCENGKPIVILSDMYLPEQFLERLLIKSGYHNVIKVFVSSSYRKSKWDGTLFSAAKEELQKKFGEEIRLIHVGDHLHSDVKMAKKHGFAALHYPNADSSGMIYRAQDMSALVGGAYRGIVDHHLHTGWKRYSMEYEYGYVYGGIFALGYCTFLHEYVKKNQIDRLLFFSRDGDVLKKVYDMLYPGGQTCYVYWSRAAALKLTADENRYDFFRRFLYHKVNKKKNIRQILREMELEPLLTGNGEKAEELLTDKNVGELKRFLLRHWDEILAVYQEQREAAKRYYAQILDGCGRAAAVDIGWAGSGYMALRTLVEDVWKFPCRLTGILAGTNTLQNAEPDIAEPQIQSGRLVSYLFSQAHNRDLLKKHDPGRDDNVYWELLTASPTRQFLGFALSESGERGDDGRQGLGITLRFGNAPANQAGCVQIQNGIMDFVKEYRQRFSAYPYMYAVSGRDAYAPMLAAEGNHGRYLRQIAGRFGMEIEVSCEGEIVCRSM
ncbi:MAG: hypothetical protein NC409_06470 [Clostridium sp.]|nr:hypothetical protein [Clostridium sp.]